MFYTDFIESSSQPWGVKLIMGVLATCILFAIKMFISELLKTFMENRWMFMNWLKEICQFLLKKTLINILRKLACVFHHLIVREFFRNILYNFRHYERFTEPTLVVAL